MMSEYCVLCHRVHKASNWKYSSYRDIEGNKYGWFCGKWFKPSNPEFVPTRIKDQRNEYFNSLLQPTRGGELSKEYIEKYGAGRLQATEKEIKKAKYVWKDLPGWNHRHKSK